MQYKLENKQYLYQEFRFGIIELSALSEDISYNIRAIYIPLNISLSIKYNIYFQSKNPTHILSLSQKFIPYEVQKYEANKFTRQ